MGSIKRNSVFFAYGWLVLLSLIVLFIKTLPLADPLQVDLIDSLQPPSFNHLAGTDELGRDVLSRVFHAAQSTLMVTIGATALNIFLAVCLGIGATYRGGAADKLLGLIIDLFWSIPFTVFVVLIISVIGVNTWSLILTIGLINWVTAARVIRAETKIIQQNAYVRAAQAFGFSPIQIIFGHLISNLKKTIFVLSAYTAIEVLTLESGLAFIGLSLPVPAPTWGGMLAQGLSYLSSGWWITLSAAVFITLTLASLQTLARSIEKNNRERGAII